MPRIRTSLRLECRRLRFVSFPWRLFDKQLGATLFLLSMIWDLRQRWKAVFLDRRVTRPLPSGYNCPEIVPVLEELASPCSGAPLRSTSAPGFEYSVAQYTGKRAVPVVLHREGHFKISFSRGYPWIPLPRVYREVSLRGRVLLGSERGE